MLGKRRSYADAVQARRKTARRLGVLVLVYFCYILLTSLFLTAYAARSQSMAPTVIPGDRILATPLSFGPRTVFGKLPGFTRPARGDLVVVEPNYARRPGFWENFSDSFVRFVTFQLLSPARRGSDKALSSPSLLRVVALPGDTIEMDDFIFKVKSSGSEQYLTEFEFSTNRYDIRHEDPPESWGIDLPGSGHMDALVLGKDQYFVAGDSRSSSSDSRHWGAVRGDRFLGKVLLRYWPPSRFGAP